MGVPVVFGSSTPSVAVADRGVPVSVYCPFVTLTVVVSVVEAVVGDAVVTAEETEDESEGIGEYVPDTGSDDLGPVDVSVPELTTDGELTGVDVADTVDEVALEEDEAELLA